MPIENTSFSCKYCGSVYGSKERALACEGYYDKLQEYKKTLLPWKWYRLSNTYGSSTTDVFVKEIKYNYACVSSDSCIRQNVCLFSYNWNNYYKVGEDWKIDEILSPMEMYRKYGIFLDGGKYSRGDTLLHSDPSVHGMPRSVAEELDVVNQTVIKDLQEKLLNSKSKEELARDLIIKQHPMLEYTDYLSKAIEYQEKYNNGEDYSITARIKGLDCKDKDPLVSLLEDFSSPD